MTTVAERVAEIVAPTVEALGLDLYDIEHAGGSLRVLVDREGGVDLEAITAVSRSLSRALDELDLIAEHYTLEVSSPGLERPLRRPDHYATAARSHEQVHVKTKPGVEGDRRVDGTVDAADHDGVTIRLADGSTRTLRYDDIERARTTFEWGPAPRPGKKEANR